MECLSISECLYLFLERFQVFIAEVLHLLGQVYFQIFYFLLTFVNESIYTTCFPVYLLVVYRKGIDVFELILYPFIIDLPQQRDCMWHGRRLWFRQGKFRLKPIGGMLYRRDGQSSPDLWLGAQARPLGNWRSCVEGRLRTQMGTLKKDLQDLADLRLQK